jgi:LysR family transcriptional regulator, regulator for bpeEF and oprC
MSGFGRFLAFACVVRRGSFARAGRELALTPSTVAKRISGLERELGVKLFHRTTRQVQLTGDGQALYVRCEKILADIGELENLAAGTNVVPRGELRLNLPITYGKQVVMPVIAHLLREHPELRADVRLSDQQCDLIRDGIDAAVRIMTLDEPCVPARPMLIGMACRPIPISCKGTASSCSAIRHRVVSGRCNCRSTKRCLICIRHTA